MTRSGGGGPLDELRRLDSNWGELRNLVFKCWRAKRVTEDDEDQYSEVLGQAQVLHGRVSGVVGVPVMEQLGRQFDAFQFVLAQPSLSDILGGAHPTFDYWDGLWALAASAIRQAIGRLEAQGRAGGQRARGAADVAARAGEGRDAEAGVMDEAQTEYFVAHEFTRAEMDDLRKAIAAALAGSGLKPYYADNEVREGHIFKDKILPKIRATRFGIYDLSNPEKPNVFMELGAAIGMGKRYFIICRQGTDFPSDVLGLDRIEYESYAHLTRQLKAKTRDAWGGLA